MNTLLVVFILSCVASLILTPLVRRVAARIGLVDRPDGRRKIHTKPIPLGGGVAILVSVCIAIGAAFTASPLCHEFLADRLLLLGIFLGAVAISVTGLVDDYWHLCGRHKLMGQCLAVALVIGCGVRVDSIHAFDVNFELGLFAVPFTAFFLLGVINSLNLLDGMDGLLSSVGLIICLAMATLAFFSGHGISACIAVALAGALLGFLRYNFPPASIFMGDCGSMLVGLLVGVVAIRGSLKGPATAAILTPIAVLTIPIFDTLAAIIRRKLTGCSLYSTDRGHLHHRLLGQGMTRRRVLLLVSLFCLLALIGALASVAFHSELIAISTFLLVVAILIVTRLFGYSEYMLIRNRLVAIVPNKLRVSHTDNYRKEEIHIQGTADWSRLWDTILELVPRLNLTKLCLKVNAPVIHERYHASWSQNLGDLVDANVWHAEIPLIAAGRTLGVVQVAGPSEGQSPSRKLVAMASLLENIEPMVCEIAGLAHESPQPTSSQPVVETDAVQELLLAPPHIIRELALAGQATPGSNGHRGNGYGGHIRSKRATTAAGNRLPRSLRPK